MRTKTIELFQYAELSDAAKEKARDWYRNASAGDEFWSECAIESIKEAGEFLGIDFDTAPGRKSQPAIYYSGFWSQGDGCSYAGTWRAKDCKPDALAAEFTGDGKANAELRRIAAALGAIVAKYPESYARVSASHRGHCLTVECDAGDEMPNNAGLNYESDEYDAALEAWREEFPADDITELLRDFAAWGYRFLESEYEYQNSDETVSETIIANEYEFTAEGDLA